jgi:ADP-ribose pyrophosphatase YjhB (NUDIX family)
MKLTLLAESKDYNAAVAIIQYRNRWLLGLSSADDDRKGRWCMVGGRIKNGETPEQAAVREAKEESGIDCRAVGGIKTIAGKKGVAFVHCKAKKLQDPTPNHEFSAMAWFTKKDMDSLKLYHNVKKLLSRV